MGSLDTNRREQKESLDGVDTQRKVFNPDAKQSTSLSESETEQMEA
jgi:hypothetical protein